VVCPRLPGQAVFSHLQSRSAAVYAPPIQTSHVVPSGKATTRTPVRRATTP